MENKDMARPIDKVLINPIMKKGDIKKMLQLPYTHPTTSSEQNTVKNNTK